MAENLKVTHYRDGTPIPNVTDPNVWEWLTSGACCEYDNDSSNVSIYGKLYNWYAVDDSQGLAPDGWHIPTDEEWKTLEMYLGMSEAAADSEGQRGTDEGSKLKEAGTTRQPNPNNATNESGFSGLPGGHRGFDGNYYQIGQKGSFWSSTGNASYICSAWGRSLYYYSTRVRRNSNIVKSVGLSVRCLRGD